MTTNSDDRNPVALVVGAGDFIGSAIARLFAKGGYTLCLGRRNGDQTQPLVDEIKSSGGEAHGFSLDARDEEQIESRFAWIEAEIGPLEVVIFNPGGNVNFPIRDTTSRVFTKVWEMACYGGFLTGREAAKYMAPREKGSIFFTGATASLRGGAGFGAFASAKFALRGLAQALARELDPLGIHVAHLVIDSGVDTAWVRGMIAKTQGVDSAEIPDDVLMKPKSVGEAYWMLHNQARDGWTFELDLRPYGEKW